MHDALEQNAARESSGDSPDLFVSFIDFSASPFALGDVLTWNIRACCEALDAGATAMDVVALTDPDKLGNAFQNFISPVNYLRLYTDLLPAFYTNPMLRNLHHRRDREGFELRMRQAQANGQGQFPGFEKYEQGLRHREAIYNRHAVLNRHFERTGKLPRLVVPPAHRLWAEGFLKSHNPYAFAVTVHVRRREAETAIFGAALERDGSFDVWAEFFDEALRRHPETLFLLPGKADEWPRWLLRRSNVIILKTLGLGLMEELAMIQACDLFMGLLSGPAVMAYLSEVPHALFVQPSHAAISAEILGIGEGAPRLPFGGRHQTFHWQRPDKEALLAAFEEKFQALRGAE